MRPVEHLAVEHHVEALERAVEADDEPVAEVLGHAAAVARRVAHNRAVVGHHAHVGTAVEGIDDHARLVRCGEGEAQHGGALRRHNLRADVVVGQVDRIVVGTRLLALVREPALARLLVELIGAAHRHERELTVVVDPRRGLVRLLEAPDCMGAVGVGPAVAHLARLGRPEVHAPGQGDGRIGVARREREVRERAHERRDIFRGAQLRLGISAGIAARAGVGAAAHGGGQQQGEKRSYHDFSVFSDFAGQSIELSRSTLPSFTSLRISSPKRVFCQANQARVKSAAS